MIEVTKEVFYRVLAKIPYTVSFLHGELDTLRYNGITGLWREQCFAKKQDTAGVTKYCIQECFASEVFSVKVRDFFFDKESEVTAKEQLRLFSEEVNADIRQIRDLAAVLKSKYNLGSKTKPSQISDALVRLNHNAMRDVLNHFSVLNEEREKSDLLKKYEARNAEEIAKKERAAIYCLANRLALGVDFTLENAIEKANETAFNVRFEEALKAGKPVDFSGKDCSCNGWIPSLECNRCQCGNHRVGYSSSNGFDFENSDNFYASTY